MPKPAGSRPIAPKKPGVVVKPIPPIPPLKPTKPGTKRRGPKYRRICRMFAIASRDWDSNGFISRTLTEVSANTVGVDRVIGFFSAIFKLAWSLQ
jgi:hypothetical protein